MAITTAPGAITAAVRLIGPSPDVVVDHARPGGHGNQDEGPDELDDQPDAERPVLEGVLGEADHEAVAQHRVPGQVELLGGQRLGGALVGCHGIPPSVHRSGPSLRLVPGWRDGPDESSAHRAPLLGPKVPAGRSGEGRSCPCACAQAGWGSEPPATS